MSEAALRDDRPIHFGKRTVRADHFDRTFFAGFGETHRFGVAQFLRQGHYLLDQFGIRAGVGAGDKILGVRVRDDVAVVVDDENIAAAHAGVLQAVQDGIE